MLYVGMDIHKRFSQVAVLEWRFWMSLVVLWISAA